MLYTNIKTKLNAVATTATTTRCETLAQLQPFLAMIGRLVLQNRDECYNCCSWTSSPLCLAFQGRRTISDRGAG